MIGNSSQQVNVTVFSGGEMSFGYKDINTRQKRKGFTLRFGRTVWPSEQSKNRGSL